jgi:hypothetical protein
MTLFLPAVAATPALAPFAETPELAPNRQMSSLPKMEAKSGLLNVTFHGSFSPGFLQAPLAPSPGLFACLLPWSNTSMFPSAIL